MKMALLPQDSSDDEIRLLAEQLPLFSKWFDLLTILSLSKERGDLPARSRFGEGRGEIF